MELKDFFRENPRVALGFQEARIRRICCTGGGAWRAGAAVFCEKLYFSLPLSLPTPGVLRALGVELAVLEVDVLSPGSGAEQSAGPLLPLQARPVRYIAGSGGAGRIPCADGRHQCLRRRRRPPGMRAIRELSVGPPCGNAEYKGGGAKAVQEAGLFTWDKPAYACL